MNRPHFVNLTGRTVGTSVARCSLSIKPGVPHDDVEPPTTPDPWALEVRWFLRRLIWRGVEHLAELAGDVFEAFVRPRRVWYLADGPRPPHRQAAAIDRAGR